MAVLVHEPERRRVIRLLPVQVPTPAPMPETDPLELRALRLWPESPRNRGEWMRAVRLVRTTSRGWLLERPL